MEKDGYLYGRGVLDDKAMAAIWVTTLIRFVREGFVPNRDVIVALTADEEEGYDNGVSFLLEHRKSLIDAELALNEGGGGEIRAGKYVANEVQIAEKLEESYVLEVTNRGGLSAEPRKGENAIYRLAAALTRLGAHEFPVALSPVTRAYFGKVAALEGGQLAADMRAAADPNATPSPEAMDRLAAASPWFNSLLRTTCVATQVEGGQGETQLPQRARATLNCRVMPGERLADVESTLHRVLADEAISVTAKWHPADSPQSPMPAELLACSVERITKDMWPGVVVVPTLLPAATDGKYLRAAGIPTYGVSGLFYDIDDEREHGNDERIGGEAVRGGAGVPVPAGEGAVVLALFSLSLLFFSLLSSLLLLFLLLLLFSLSLFSLLSSSRWRFAAGRDNSTGWRSTGTIGLQVRQGVALDELAASLRAALDWPLVHDAELVVTAGVGARRAPRGLPSAGAGRGAGSGARPRLLVGPGTVHVLLALAHPAALAPCDAPRLVNRYVRPLLRALTRVGATAHYFGRDWISVRNRPAAWVGFAHEVASNRAVFEAFVAVSSPFAIEARGSFLDREPGTLESLAGRPLDLDAVVRAICEAYGGAYGPGLQEMRPAATRAPPVDDDDTPWSATVLEAIGTLGAGPDRNGVFRVGGDLLVSRDAPGVARAEASPRSPPTRPRRRSLRSSTKRSRLPPSRCTASRA